MDLEPSYVLQPEGLLLLSTSTEPRSGFGLSEFGSDFLQRINRDVTTTDISMNIIQNIDQRNINLFMGKGIRPLCENFIPYPINSDGPEQETWII